MKRRTFTSKVGKAPGNRLLPDHFQTALPMLLPNWAENSFVLFCPIGEQWLLRYFGVLLHGHCCISHPTCERNFHFNLLERAIEIREIISDVNKKDTPRFAGKNFVSTDQRYRKIVACMPSLPLVPDICRKACPTIQAHLKQDMMAKPADLDLACAATAGASAQLQTELWLRFSLSSKTEGCMITNHMGARTYGISL